MTTTLHSARCVLPISAPPVSGGAVAVAGGRILAVGTRDELRATYPDAPERHWDGVLTPGLVNAHTHLNYSHCAHFYGNGKPFDTWIQDFAPVIAGTTPDGWRAAAAEGVRQMLATGTTAAADVVTGPAALTVQQDAGLAGVAYLEAVFHDTRSWSRARAGWYAALPDGAGISPHTPYTLDTPVLAELAAQARARGVRLHPHAAETVQEVAFTATGSGPFADLARAMGLELGLAGRGSGRTPVAELDAAGLLGPDSHVAHGIHVSAADRALLRERGTVVALCPRSNARLESGEAPVAAYRAEGNVVAVGTDSLASVSSLDLLADVAALYALALRQGSPAAGLDRWVVEAATVGGARALGRSDLGVLAQGARADLAVFDVGARDPYAALVAEGAGSCVATLVAGDLVSPR
ncbi:MAG TPA: amidohydrolase family protein [Mycobacteriales bacterium]|nr:amidohydrolase family protein [Mycobacteriales bacterium]